jgi:hypothetical protein
MEKEKETIMNKGGGGKDKGGTMGRRNEHHGKYWQVEIQNVDKWGGNKQRYWYWFSSRGSGEVDSRGRLVLTIPFQGPDKALITVTRKELERKNL